MASLWYDTLGNKSYCPPGNASCSAAQPGWGLTNTGAFQNLQSGAYWSGLEYPPGPYNVWDFSTLYGSQGYGGNARSLYALAVRPGDVLVSAIPEPETYALMLAGLAVVGFVALRRTAK
jgi:hypothetical protein